MSPSERSFMLLLFTETSKNTIWHSPALVVSNKWASSPRSNWPGHVWHHEFWVPWLLEKEKFEIWSSRIRWLLSWPGQRCQEAYSNNSKIFFLTDLEARVQGQYIWHHVDSWLYPNLLPSPGSGPHGWVTTSMWSVISHVFSVSLSVSSSKTPTI